MKPSNKIFDAKKFGFTAVQKDDELEKSSANLQNEDCLTLNNKKTIPESQPSRFVHDMQHAAKLTEDFMNLSGTRN